jgi:hypothetical protein
MTTTTLHPTIVDRPTTTHDAPTRPRYGDVVRSEWTKLRSVRSTYWTLLVTALATVGIAAVATAIYAHNWPTASPLERATFNATSFSLTGVFLAQLAVGVLGILTITSEYSTGSIRSTFAAVPQRRTVLAAKATVFGAVTLVISVVSAFGAFFVGQALLSSQGIQASIGDPGVLRAVLGAGVYLGVLGLFALGLGTLIRHGAGAIAALFGIVFVLPALAMVLPSSWRDTVSMYLPSEAGQAMYRAADPGTAHLSPTAGLLVFSLYAAIALVAAAFVLNRRDA